MLEIEQVQTIAPEAPQRINIDKSFILNELKNIIGQGSEFAACEILPQTPNSLDYHVNDQIEIVEEPVSPAGY